MFVRKGADTTIMQRASEIYGEGAPASNAVNGAASNTNAVSDTPLKWIASASYQTALFKPMSGIFN